MSKRKSMPLKLVSKGGNKNDSNDPQREELSQQAPKAPSEAKKIPRSNVTYHLPDEVISQLERLWFEVRLDMGRRNISKSNFVEAAIRMAVNDYKENKLNGELVALLKDGLAE